uniref:Uncharacterized protein n=1 Tax=Streptomyces flaveolus TaxID=67297 RepID=H9TE82_9ACTN|nr:hypothetical protein [Streptomyces flaveolus]
MYDSDGRTTASADTGFSTAAICKTDELDFKAAASGMSGMKDEVYVSLKSQDSHTCHTCRMRGFPGVQLVDPDGLGGTGPEAARADAPDVYVYPVGYRTGSGK